VTELEEVAAKLDRLYEAVKTHNEWMEWGKTELEKLFKSASPVLALAAPLVAQMTAGNVPAPDTAGPQQVQAPAPQPAAEPEPEPVPVAASPDPAGVWVETPAPQPASEPAPVQSVPQPGSFTIGAPLSPTYSDGGVTNG
jgi:hypothetical protein